jgi:hypothetical protein
MDRLRFDPGSTIRVRVLPCDRYCSCATGQGLETGLNAEAHIPVCVVAFGRDQFEVARRVEVAGCGTRLPAKRLSAERLRIKVPEAMTMTDGAQRVAAGFAATGGVARGAGLFEQRVLLGPMSGER